VYSVSELHQILNRLNSQNLLFWDALRSLGDLLFVLFGNVITKDTSSNVVCRGMCMQGHRAIESAQADKDNLLVFDTK